MQKVREPCLSLSRKRFLRSAVLKAARRATRSGAFVRYGLSLTWSVPRESLSPLATSRVYAKKKERASLLFPPTSVAEIAWAYCVGVMGFNAGALMVWSYVAREVERSPLCLEWCNAPQRPVFAGGAARCAQTCLFAGVCRNFFSFIRFLWTTFKIYFRMHTCMYHSSIVSILLIT